MEKKDQNGSIAYRVLLLDKRRVSDLVRHKPGCIDTEDGWRLRKRRDCTILKAKTKALTSCEVSVQLISAFVFAYEKRMFSHDAAHIS